MSTHGMTPRKCSWWPGLLHAAQTFFTQLLRALTGRFQTPLGLLCLQQFLPRGTQLQRRKRGASGGVSGIDGLLGNGQLAGGWRGAGAAGDENGDAQGHCGEQGSGRAWCVGQHGHSGLQIAFTVGSEFVTPACWSCSTKLAYFRRGSGGLAGGPASSSPGPALFLVEEGPGQQAALLLALTRGDYPHIPYRQCGQPGTQGRQVGGPGHQGGEPEHLTGDGGALINHARQETGFATVAHEFVVPTAEVQQRLPIGVSAEIAPLALAAPDCFGQVGMEGGIAQGEIEALVTADQTPEDLLGPPLVA